MTETSRIVSGVDVNTYREMQLGPGMLMVDFDYTGIETVAEFYQKFSESLLAGHSLGATRGGINVNIAPQKRRREVDGVTQRFVGDSVIDSWECYFTAELLQFSPKVLQAVFPTAEFDQKESDADGRKITSMCIRTGLTADDHVQNICWIATTDYGLIMFALHNALGQADGELSAENASEGTIPFRADGYVGNIIENPEAMDYAPCEVWFIDRIGGSISKEMVGS